MSAPKKDVDEPIFYVYALVDPRNGLPFYIGKGKNNRCRTHVSEWRRGGDATSNVDKLQRIGEIISAGLDVYIETLLDGLTEAGAYAYEEQQIVEYRAQLPPGTLTNSLREMSPWRYTLRRLTRAIAHLAIPRQYKWHVLQTTGKLPSDAEWANYTEIYMGHLNLRDALIAEAEKADAEAAQRKAARDAA